MHAIDLIRLLHLASPALPVGAYSYSQALEWAVEDGTIHNGPSAQSWMQDALRYNLAQFELPYLAAMQAAWDMQDAPTLDALNADWLATRETAELRAETVQMGYSLRELIRQLDILPPKHMAHLAALDAPGFPTAFAAIAAHWQLPTREVLLAYAWSWLENQTMAALKTVPLGQVAGQKVLLNLGAEIEQAVDAALQLKPAEANNFTPGLAIASAQHETQYSRLFRS